MSKAYLKPLFQKLCKQREDKMKNKHGFTPFTERLPEQGRWILVTNNLEATEMNGEMSRLWLVNFWHKHPEGHRCCGEITSFDDGDRELHNLTHWKYAVEEGG